MDISARNVFEICMKHCCEHILKHVQSTMVTDKLVTLFGNTLVALVWTFPAPNMNVADHLSTTGGDWKLSSCRCNGVIQRPGVTTDRLVSFPPCTLGSH